MRFAVCAMVLMFFLVCMSASEASALRFNPKHQPGNSFSSNFNTERFTITCNHPATNNKLCSGRDTLFQKFYYETPVGLTDVITCPDNSRTKCITTQQMISFPVKLEYKGKQYRLEKLETFAYALSKRFSPPTKTTYINGHQYLMTVRDAPYGVPIHRELTFYYKSGQSTLTVFGTVELKAGYK